MADRRRTIEAIWMARGRRASFLRAVLTPAELLYRAIVGVRGKLYDWRVFPAEDFSIPVLSVGNLTVGGTGKTPISAWFARRILDRGVVPAIVLRGYGGDETIVHQRLNEGIPVIEQPDRARGIREAIATGAGAVVLDDAFQHRRAKRDADVVLINADAWSGRPRLLPAGPWREPLKSARRATLIVVTRKIADKSVVDDIRRALANVAPRVPVVSVQLVPAEFKSTATGQTLPLQAVHGADLTAIAAIADPDAFFKQLTELGAIVRPISFPDHHAFKPEELEFAGDAAVLMTEKDAVKLRRVAQPNWWVLPVTAELDAAFGDWLSEKLDGFRRSKAA